MGEFGVVGGVRRLFVAAGVGLLVRSEFENAKSDRQARVVVCEAGQPSDIGTGKSESASVLTRTRSSVYLPLSLTLGFTERDKEKHTRDMLA